MTYRHRKLGLTDRKIHAEKHAALVATYSSNKRAKAAIMRTMYGGKADERFEPMRVLTGRGNSPLDVHQVTHSFTEHGDFHHLDAVGTL